MKMFMSFIGLGQFVMVFMPTEFVSLAELCEKVSGTTKRTLMVDYVADFLKRLQLDGYRGENSGVGTFQGVLCREAGLQRIKSLKEGGYSVLVKISRNSMVFARAMEL